MKTVLSIVIALALAGTIGCQSSSPRGGSQPEGQGFTIVVPSSRTEIKQGESQSVAVTLNRADFFKRDVSLTIKTTDGINVQPGRVLIKSSEKPNLHVQVTADRDAALGDYVVYVNATPETGQPTSTQFTVKVIAP